MNTIRATDASDKKESSFLYTKGIPKDLVLEIQRTFRVSEFLETGTYMGRTTIWAAELFPRVITIERSAHYHNQLKGMHSCYPNVEFVFGHSGLELDRLVRSLSGPSVFWLDGHWSGENTYGERDECPLLSEIESINRSPHEHFLFIDDARMFLAPPPHPHLPDQWPTIVQVIDALRSGGRKPYVVVFSDVIIACPEWAKRLISEWCQAAATQRWERELTSSNRKSENPQEFLLSGARGVGNRIWPVIKGSIGRVSRRYYR